MLLNRSCKEKIENDSINEGSSGCTPYFMQLFRSDSPKAKNKLIKLILKVWWRMLKRTGKVRNNLNLIIFSLNKKQLEFQFPSQEIKKRYFLLYEEKRSWFRSRNCWFWVSQHWLRLYFKTLGSLKSLINSKAKLKFS